MVCGSWYAALNSALCRRMRSAISEADSLGHDVWVYQGFRMVTPNDVTLLLDEFGMRSRLSPGFSLCFLASSVHSDDEIVSESSTPLSPPCNLRVAHIIMSHQRHCRTPQPRQLARTFWTWLNTFSFRAPLIRRDLLEPLQLDLL